MFAVEPAVKQPKYISFIWTGPNASIKTKAAATAIKASVLKYFEVRWSAPVRSPPLRPPVVCMRFTQLCNCSNAAVAC